MKLQKSLLAGSTALGLLIGGAVQASAADARGAPAPKVEERTPVYACKSLGFWELPGTDICFKVGGYAKAIFIWQEDDANSPDAFAASAITTRLNGAVQNGGAGDDNISFHALESRLNFDARSFTEYGTVRSFIEFDFFTPGGPGASLFAGGGQRISNSFSPRLRHAYVQVGNLLAGQFWSAYTYFPIYFESASFGGARSETFIRQAQLRWTQAFGNGFRVIVSLENPEAIGFGLAAAGVVKNPNNEILPDGIIVLQVNQSWGGLQAGAVVRDLNFVTAAGTNADEFGWGVHVGARINLPFGNNKSYIAAEGQFADGGNRYVFGSGTTIGDAYWTAATGLQTIETWGVVVGGQFWVSDTVRFNAFVDYMKNEDVFANIAGLGAAAEELWTIRGNVAWSPVPRLDLILEGNWGDRRDQNGADGDAFWVAASIRRSF